MARLRDWLVCLLAERSYDLLRSLDVAAHYEVGSAWARRHGQVILR